MPNQHRSPADQEALDRIAADKAAGKDPFGDDEPIVPESTEQRVTKAKKKAGVVEPDDADVAAAADEAAQAQADADALAEANRIAKADAEGTDPTPKPKAGKGKGKAAAAAQAVADAADEAAEEVAEGEEGEGEEGEVGEADEGEEEAADLELVEQVLDERVNDAPRPYTGKSPKELAADVAALRKEELDAHKAMMAGGDDDVYFQKKAEVDAKIDAANREIARAELRIDAIDEHETRIVTAIMDLGTSQGVKYHEDGKARTQFNTVLNAAMADPDNAKRSFKSIAKEAHNIVLAMRGIASAKNKRGDPDPDAQPGAKKDKTPPARVMQPGPTTLRTVPAASTPNTGNTLLDAGRHLKGAAYESWYKGLTKAQKSKLLDD